MSVLRSDRLPPLLLAVFAALGALPVVRSLLVADLNWCYPYVTSDSYDWIANGLSWAGENLAANPRGVVTDPGTHTITVTRPGYKSKTVGVTVRIGAPVDIVVELEK